MCVCLVIFMVKNNFCSDWSVMELLGQLYPEQLLGSCLTIKTNGSKTKKLDFFKIFELKTIYISI